MPESLSAVISSGITLDKAHYAASLRVRYFGPRVLTQDGTQNSTPSTLLNTQFSAKLPKGRRITVDIYNLLNSSPDDIEYYYASWAKSDAALPALARNAAINPLLASGGVEGGGVNDDHFHPAELRDYTRKLPASALERISDEDKGLLHCPFERHVLAMKRLLTIMLVVWSSLAPLAAARIRWVILRSNHLTKTTFSDGGVSVHYVLDMAEIPAYQRCARFLRVEN